MIRTVISAVFLLPIFLFGQSAPIVIDGSFDDWNSSLATSVDQVESNSGVDILSFQVTNDAEHLFIKIEVNTEIDLIDDEVPHEMYLYLDTDNNASTGFSPQVGYGAELGIDLSDRNAYYNVVPNSTLDLHDFGYTQAPTVTGKFFELAIARSAIPDGINPLFPSNTIKVLLRETNSGDAIPDVGGTFSYTFDNTPVAFSPISVSKDDPSHVRIVAYNTEQDGLLNASTVTHLEDVITALNADVYGFSECYSTTAANVKNFLDAWLPLGTANGWYVVKDDYDLITAARWPFSDWWTGVDRQFPALIDMPASYGTDLLFTNAHLHCCANDWSRQQEVDEYAAFILDAKTVGGQIDLPVNTPFVYGGDLNLVGFEAQLNTLLTGDIVNSGIWGTGAALDWDDTDLVDAQSRHTHEPESYTWQNLGSSYPPGRLDFLIHSDAVMSLEKSFVLRSESLPSSVLSGLGLSSYSTQAASDHFPVVADYTLGIPKVTVALKAFLGGPYNGQTMDDALRSSSLLPFTEPYTGLGFMHVGGGGEVVSPSVFSLTGNNAIVDWVFLELRSATDNTLVKGTRSALLQRDGDIVDVDGVSPVCFEVSETAYHVVVRHRNHLGVMTANPISLTDVALSIDLSDGSVPLYGANAIDNMGGVGLLWSGNVVRDEFLKYTGLDNDRDVILQAIGGSDPTNVVQNTYSQADVNLDGEVKYTGLGNDRDIILVNVGGSIPTATRTEQLP